MAAGLALVGCSSEDDMPNGGTDPATGETGYIAVNIVQPKTVGSRAQTGGSVNDNLTVRNPLG